ncbi:LacI family DNA-binding transcriptional regulator [Thalassospira alkalitolerans]|uniref:LacI family DNA-binding transcriptional regulator n=1 Tax=Thalassospira alkalitolerans TaxID=1293890 RepID=UPI003AA9B21B
MPKTERKPEAKQNTESSSGTVTMEAVGRLAGVSQVTVSRALNNPSKVSAKTLERIKNAIELTGYVPNMVAGALASKRSHLIVALIPSITNFAYSEFIKHFIQVMRGYGYHVLTAETGLSQEEEESILATMLSRRPDGIMMTGINHSAKCKRMILGSGIPVVEIWDITASPIDTCVGFSHAKSGEETAKFAYEKGYRHALAISAGDERALRRKDAFCDTFNKLTQNQVDEICLPGQASLELGRSSLAQAIENGFKSGVVMCSSDLLAHGVIIEAQTRHLKIPQDIAVIGFGNQNFAAFTAPALTTVKVDRAYLGSQAAKALMTRIDQKPLENKCIDIGFEIVARDSA